MAEKGLTKRDLEQVFTGFEKRQDKKLKGLEERVHSELEGLEERGDSRFKDFEERVDAKLKNLEERVVDQFHIISEGLVDQIKLLAEGHAGIIERLTLMEKENERQHLETRSLVKLSFTEMDRRLTDLETQMKEMQDWKKQVEGRLQI
jgi:hypothetical protein